jgi:hypothetical protein
MESAKPETENNVSLSWEKISTEERLPAIDVQNESSTEISTSQVIAKTGISFGVKLAIWVIWIPVLWASAFLGLNYYEASNDCTLELKERIMSYSDILSPVMCVKNRKFNFWDSGCVALEWDFCVWLDKPLILLYPETEQEVSVELEYAPGFSATFPEYDTSKKGWSVTANPDGTLLDHSTLQETYGLFWEGNLTHANYNTSKGWVIKGWEVREFLYEKLTEIGLNTKEKSDFIMFWYPKLQDYSYVQITFAGEDYNQSAPLKITPKPDSFLRVFMVAKPLDAPIQIEPQILEKFERKGFSVVEWGGTIITAH